MPSLLTKPAAAVRDPSEEDADRPGSRGGAKGGKDSKKGAAAGRGKGTPTDPPAAVPLSGLSPSVPLRGFWCAGGAAAAPEPTFIEKPNEAQPAPTETIKPATGVTLTTVSATLPALRGLERCRRCSAARCTRDANCATETWQMVL